MTTLATPTTNHGPECRTSVSDYHAGQIVTPILRAWRKGKGRYLVVLQWYDASDRTYSDPLEFVGDFWNCVKFLCGHGVRGADVDC